MCAEKKNLYESSPQKSPITPALFRQYHGTKAAFYASNETKCFNKRLHLDDYSLGAEKKSTPLKKNLSPGLSPFLPFVCMNSF